MLPRWHILWGAVFTIIVFAVSPQTHFIYLALIFLSSVFIDLDHYFVAVKRSGRLSLNHAFEYHKVQEKIEIQEYNRKLYQKGDFHLFHTIEFHLLIAILGYFWTPFFYIFIGMLFHSLLDLVSLVYDDRLYRREFFLTMQVLRSRKTTSSNGPKQKTTHKNRRKKAI